MALYEREVRDAARVFEQEGLCVSLEEVPITSLTLPPQLQERFPKDYDPAMVRQLTQAIRNGTVTLHALVTKELVGEDRQLYLELLHKPSVVFALQQSGIDTVQVVVIHQNDGLDLDTATERQLMYLGENGALIDHQVRDIPIANVVSDDSIVDEEHRDILKDQLATGQQVNIWVRPQMKNGRIIYDVVDGYHRTDALRDIGARFVEARVSYGMTDEELHDERVRAAARSAKAVKFPRMITSMQRSYSESQWGKYGLRLSQILSMAVNAGTTKHPGKNLGLSDEVAQAAIRWVRQKALLWNSDVGSLYQQIHSAEESFPEIIGQVRTTQGGGHVGDGVFNPVKFFAMVEQLAGNLHHQKIMVSIIKKHNLNTDQVRVVSKALASIDGKRELTDLLMSNPCDPDVLTGILGGKVLYMKGKMVHQPKTPSVAEDNIQDNGNDDTDEPLTTNLDEIAPIDEIVTLAQNDNIFQRPQEVPHPEYMEPDYAILPAKVRPARPLPVKDDQTYNRPRSPKEYEDEIAQLQQSLEQVNIQLARGGKNKYAWYETLATLTDQERDIMRCIMKMKHEGMDISEINAWLKRQYKLTDNKLMQIKRSALSKWSIFLQNMLEGEFDNIV